MDRALLIIQVSRPIVWPLLPLVYYLGIHAANAELSWAAALQLFVLSFPMSLIGCGLNDIFDYESDRRSSRRRLVWGSVISSEDRALVWRGCLAMIPVFILSGVATRNWGNFLATIGLVVIAWFYSVPPLRLKERPPLDSLANGLGYFLLPLGMGYSLGADLRTMPLRYYLLALCVCGVHALATAADYDADRAAGHRTLATVYGRRRAAILACMTFLVTLISAEFHGTAVKIYIGVCSAVTLAAALAPTNRVITAACTAIFAGFLVAAVCHIFGV